MLSRRAKTESTASACQVGPSPALAIRIETADRSFSYLAAEVRSWVFIPDGEQEVLVVRTGREVFTVRGTGLHLARDALEQQRLQALRISVGRGGRAEEAWISAIEVTEA